MQDFVGRTREEDGFPRMCMDMPSGFRKFVGGVGMDSWSLMLKMSTAGGHEGLNSLEMRTSIDQQLAATG